ncbi:LysR family transcriptional regulator [Vibrio sp. Isolate31]|uniref:LysR family transcriptional regulator n=1 Tax=unclassified Vibrio TaxID=2614977 RepID=UPI001EFD2FDC|nr:MULTISPECIES: LysR family transcriptional regulator [unclassified Vibrio]MCG9553132.1 LysR family transcriptional regulator [Vibrio sp. Isolate32]MCG9602967.1 LysR family transcriptional regulator [Vibrio sp. Isolate31]
MGLKVLDRIEQQWLNSFHCVYENNSFKRAAEFLGLPTSNISRHIALLEERLDIRLFDRTTRRISPTDAGEHLYMRTQPLLSKLNDALEEVTQHSHEVQGQLKVLMPDSPALAEAVVSFCQQHPSISLCCDTSINPKDDPLDGFDIVISFHRGKLADYNWVAKEIARWSSVVVASPTWLDRHPTPCHITDLSRVSCITSYTALNGSPWVFQNATGELITQKVHSTFKVNSGHLAKTGALAGLGVALLPVEACLQELDAGTLIQLNMEYSPADLVLYAFYASRKHLAKKIPMFINHIQNQATMTERT